MLQGKQKRRAAVRVVALAVALVGCGTTQSYAAEGYAGTPFGAGPFLIAAKGESKLEAENFDRGEEGAAYHDADTANAGRQSRPGDGVDLGMCNDVGGGARVGWIAAGEWLRYTVRVSAAGAYDIAFRVQSRASAGTAVAKLHFEDESGRSLTGDVNVTGTSDAWQDMRVSNVALPAGDHVLKLVFDGGGFNLNYITFTPVQSGPAQQMPAAQTPAQQNTAEVVIISEEAGGQAEASTGAPVSPLGLFTEENSIGSGETKGQVSHAQPGTYTLRGGSKIGGAADAVYLVSNKSLGDGQLVAKVESVEGDGTAGVMYRESADAGARFAAVLVSNKEGTLFRRRSETGGSVFSAMAPGAKPPVWVRVARSGKDFSAYYASGDEQPGDGAWKQIGSSKPVGMPEEVMAGLAAATGDGSAVVSGVSATGDVVAPALPVQEGAVAADPGAGNSASAGQVPLTGKVIGTEGSYDGSSGREKAFDGNMNTAFDPPTEMALAAWTGLDFGSPRRITRIGYCPRAGFAHRVVNAKFQASNSPTFTTGVVDLHTIAASAQEGQMTFVDVQAPGTYRYVRYAGGAQHVNIAEIQVFGEAGATANAASTGVMLAGTVADTEGKTVNLSQQSLDWVHWGHGRQTNRKAGVTSRISDPPGENQFFNDNHVRYSWIDGNPQRRVDNTIEAIWRMNAPFVFSVRPGDTRPHTLTVYVGGFSSMGDLTVTLPGAPQYVDRGRGNSSAHYYFAYTLQFRAATASDEVTVEWKPTGGGGNIQLHAATLR